MSLEELAVVQAFRAYSTCIQMCLDRGLVISHPSAIAAVTQGITSGNSSSSSNPYFSLEDGLDYDYFVKNFVQSPEQIREANERAREERLRNDKAKTENEEDDEGGNNDDGDGDEQLEEKWFVQRKAMRIAADYPKNRDEPKDKDDDHNTSSSGGGGGGESHRSKRFKSRALMIFFSDEPTLKIDEVLEHRAKAMEKHCEQMIIVSPERRNFKQPLLAAIDELSGRRDTRPGADGRKCVQIRLFKEDELMTRPLSHTTVPPHIPLTSAELRAFLNERKLSIGQLPRMLASDPIARYLGLQRGDVVHIVRPSKDSGAYDMYRQIV